MDKICVFCGSSRGVGNEYVSAAHEIGKLLAANNKTLVYGGGNRGLMGVLADSVLENGGRAVGVIPEFMIPKEVAHNNLTKLHVVDSMHKRKEKMANIADAFIALPGGFGTLDEVAEICTWIQLGIINKPVAILNISGYYDSLFIQLNKMMKEGFLKPESRKVIVEVTECSKALVFLKNYEAPDLSKW